MGAGMWGRECYHARGTQPAAFIAHQCEYAVTSLESDNIAQKSGPVQSTGRKQEFGNYLCYARGE